MTIDRKKIEEQLANLDIQELGFQRQLLEVQGAKRLCRHWLGMIDRAEDEAKAKSEAEAANGAGVSPENA